MSDLHDELQELFGDLSRCSDQGSPIDLVRERGICQLALMGLGAVLQNAGVLKNGNDVLKMSPSQILAFKESILKS